MSRDATPWTAAYERFGIPESLEPYPDEPVHQFLYDAADDHPAQGIVQLGQRFPYPDIRDDVDRLATALRQRGIEKGHRVATILPTSVQFVVATHAISRAGGVHIPNDFLDAEDDLVYRLEQGDPDVLIGHDEHIDLIRSLQTELELEHVLLTSLEDYSADPPDEGEREAIDGAERLRPVIDATEPDPPTVEFSVETDGHTLLFTGGTTGLPKGCLLTHRNLVANALQGVAVQSQLATAMRGSEAAVMALPMYHAYGYSITNSLLELGLDMLVVPDARDTVQMRELVERHEPLLMLGVPTQFMELVDEEVASSVVGISGSAPLAVETKSQFEREAGGVSQGYGLSEMSPITHFDVHGLYELLAGGESEDGLDHPTIGIPVPDTSVKLRDIDSGEAIPIDRAVDDELEGELLVKGPQRMTGYLDEGKDPFDEEGYVATGDIAKVDSSGRFYVVDRIKNMINVSGLKVYSEEVDEILYGLEGVERPATVGVPDPERPGSERVRIFIEPEPDADVTEQDVRDHLEGTVPRQALPSTVTFVESIPLTDIGKTDKQALREDATTEADG
ncbi:AMP-binding protein [Natrialba asiatica]|uniref:AMP-dependent synthetase and ligase n=1 Tax=Natrialba asiatica (strain ATCC 700177 / DSM 12278 / JCM 9576 / FERM P-10747 / NBRC 102637 / 172P1) TaxID=29540 RepID=M0AWY3_NATA1|nr:class I adenylate-forming enzyme family protein [Natrialba asiatica]ELZ02837.1 AMP-dependent synthetase and ligase [Natrialba asiatica DSM 12278]